MTKIFLRLTGLAISAGTAVILSAAASPAQEATLYKNPQCGCCENYADYLRENGFEVTVKPTHDLVSINREAGLAENFEGCHTAFIDDYVISGHVPVATVRKVLDERPAIKGITLPGMPMGSPGMSGAKTEPFTVYGFGDGAPEVYAIE